jgi:hypothetical protein
MKRKIKLSFTENMHSGFFLNCFTEHSTTEIVLMFVKHSIKFL